jgi:2-beta-glucuronyltransferase
MTFSTSEMDRKAGPRRRSVVILSGYHDYRSKRKADLHFIADQLKEQGEVSFLSLRFSYLTRYKEDPRHELRDRVNRFEKVDGVGCYLWRTPIHAFRLPKRFALVEKAIFAAFSSYLPKAMRSVIARADMVLVESGISIIYIPLIKRLNPNVRIIYMASDSLDAIGQAAAIKDAFTESATLIDRARVPSPYLAKDIPQEIPCYYIPHGIDKQRFFASKITLPESENGQEKSSLIAEYTSDKSLTLHSTAHQRGLLKEKLRFRTLGNDL